MIFSVKQSRIVCSDGDQQIGKRNKKSQHQLVAKTGRGNGYDPEDFLCSKRKSLNYSPALFRPALHKSRIPQNAGKVFWGLFFFLYLHMLLMAAYKSSRIKLCLSFLSFLSEHLHLHALNMHRTSFFHKQQILVVLSKLLHPYEYLRLNTVHEKIQK